jgi:hypothetical protein
LGGSQGAAAAFDAKKAITGSSSARRPLDVNKPSPTSAQRRAKHVLLLILLIVFGILEVAQMGIPG